MPVPASGRPRSAREYQKVPPGHTESPVEACGHGSCLPCTVTSCSVSCVPWAERKRQFKLQRRFRPSPHEVAKQLCLLALIHVAEGPQLYPASTIPLCPGQVSPRLHPLLTEAGKAEADLFPGDTGSSDWWLWFEDTTVTLLKLSALSSKTPTHSSFLLTCLQGSDLLHHAPRPASPVPTHLPHRCAPVTSCISNSVLASAFRRTPRNTVHTPRPVP